jgi:hypothetical protein
VQRVAFQPKQIQGKRGIVSVRHLTVVMVASPSQEAEVLPEVSIHQSRAFNPVGLFLQLSQVRPALECAPKLLSYADTAAV